MESGGGRGGVGGRVAGDRRKRKKRGLGREILDGDLTEARGGGWVNGGAGRSSGLREVESEGVYHKADERTWIHGKIEWGGECGLRKKEKRKW